ncbi:MAG: hypothetical protein NWR72_09985 [Bacteroidia bacterium]|nr:hypothetical protein [Bacteroidia bacterium]
MATQDLGMFTTAAGRKFEGYWQPDSGRVYLKLQYSALRTSLIEAGFATKEADARALASAFTKQIQMTWS